MDVVDKRLAEILTYGLQAWDVGSREPDPDGIGREAGGHEVLSHEYFMGSATRAKSHTTSLKYLRASTGSKGVTEI